MWLFNSSVGKKLVMSITGLGLVLFLTFHMAMNCVALFSAEGYRFICEFLGANWYAIVGTIGLALLMVIHICYATWLTLSNRKARGSERYAVTARPKGVEFASRNMFVLGLIVALGLVLHLCNFWAKMQLVELRGGIPADGVDLIRYTFSKWYFVLLYLIWFGAIWFHLTHGFWSAIQTIGWSNRKWFVRWKWIGYICVTLLMLGFTAVLVTFFCYETFHWSFLSSLFGGLQ